MTSLPANMFIRLSLLHEDSNNILKWSVLSQLLQFLTPWWNYDQLLWTNEAEWKPT